MGKTKTTQVRIIKEFKNKTKLKGPPFCFLSASSKCLKVPLCLFCLFTITVPGMNLPRMTAQLAALTSQEQGSY